MKIKEENMSDLNKCFRCGMFDIEGVAICRVHGHEIKNPMDESCDHLIQLDTHVDQLNELIIEVDKNEKVLLDTNKELSTTMVKIKKEIEKLKKCVQYTSEIRTFSNKNEAGAVVADKGKVFKAVYISRQTLRELTDSAVMPQEG